MLAQLAKPGDFVLVKGSRSARMETVIENLPN
jgi:UDP-N-acetylmuramyl pentapeptide synthase